VAFSTKGIAPAKMIPPGTISTGWCLITMLASLFPCDQIWSDVLYSLSPFAKFFLLLLVLVAIYTVYFTSFALLRLRSLRAVQDGQSLRKSLALLEHRSGNLRQMIVAMAYFFGLTFFLQLQNAFWTPDNNRPVGLMILENFRVYFHFAAQVFFAFLILHSIQWFVSSRIRAAALRLEP
jgi:hypothetical protein